MKRRSPRPLRAAPNTWSESIRAARSPIWSRSPAVKSACTKCSRRRRTLPTLSSAACARCSRAWAPESVTYSSTVATNALLEKKGARVALFTNAGFEDLIEIGRQNRDDLYALAPSRPEPLVGRAMRFGVAERTLFDGSIIKSLEPRGARANTPPRATQRR